MRPLFYLRRLREDVASWVSKGIISKAQGEAILADVGAAKGTSFAQLLVVLGAILAAAAAITFVAANWEGMTKIARLGALLLALVGAWAIAARFFARGANGAGQAFVLLAVGLFGATINLVGQTYHVNADYPDGLMIWALGALAAAFAVPSRTALGAALVLGAIWTWIETWQFTPGLHLPYVFFWGASAALAIILKWRGGGHLIALTGLLWLVMSLGSLADALRIEEGELLSHYAALGLSLFAFGLMSIDRPWRIAAHYGIFVFLCYSFFLHAASLGAVDEAWRDSLKEWLDRSNYFATHALIFVATAGFIIGLVTKRVPALASFAGLAIVAWNLLDYVIATVIGPPVFLIGFWIGVIAVIAIGAILGRRTLVNLGLVGFAAGVLDLYFETFKSLLGTSLVFLIGALLLFAMAFMINAIGKRLAGRAFSSEVGTGSRQENAPKHDSKEARA
jgi:uncharacterized membrane protein